MKNINSYIIEKLKLNDNIKIDKYSEVIDEIIRLCQIDNSHPYKQNYLIYLKAITNWAHENKVKIVIPFANTDDLKELEVPNEIIKEFTNNPKWSEQECTRLIISGEGKEVFGKHFDDPKIYFDKSTLIYHVYNGKKNIDRLFSIFDDEEDFDESKINEKLYLNKKTSFSIKVETKEELQNIIKERIENKKGALLDLNDIDTSEIKDMSYLFSGLEIRKIAISDWDVSNVEDMNHMFSECKYLIFDDLGNWDVSNVRDMGWMFSGCKKFEGKGLEKWDVSLLECARAMFMGDSKMDVDLSIWTPKRLQNATAMFSGCEKLNFNIESWNPNNIKDTKWMTTNTKITPNIK